MLDKGQWREFGQDTGVKPLLFTKVTWDDHRESGPRFNVSSERRMIPHDPSESTSMLMWSSINIISG